MYKKTDKNQLSFEEFSLPFNGRLRKENRWVQLAELIPWDDVENEYADNFSDNIRGTIALPARIAFGSLIIKEQLNVSDRETVLQIEENPYLQFFLGFVEFMNDVPIDHSLLTHFRKRFSEDSLRKINVIITKNKFNTANENEKSNSHDDSDPPANNGKLLVDATCTPADIKYPTDLNLLNEAREKTEEIIDTMHKPDVRLKQKPRTYRKLARKVFLSVAKQKRPGKKKMRAAIRKQLSYLNRNLETINQYSSIGRLTQLSSKQYKQLLVINDLFRQQLLMHNNRTHSVEHRIVSISQPHVRPIVRGKVHNPTEFGAKISVSLVDGMSFVDRISWDNYNESTDLIDQIKNYKIKFGYFPKSVHVDRIYRTKENRQFCKLNHIRISGPKLGRPKLSSGANSAQIKLDKKTQRQDEIDRIAIEGKFGQGKRRYSLSRIMSKLPNTSVTTIFLTFIVMNLDKLVSSYNYLCYFLCRFFNYITKSQVVLLHCKEI